MTRTPYTRPTIEDILDRMGSRCRTSREIAESMGAGRKYIDEQMFWMEKRHLVQRYW